VSAHEPSTSHEKIQPGSDRAFGLVVGSILIAIGAYMLAVGQGIVYWLWGTGSVLVAVGGLAPRWLHRANIAWTWLGLQLGRVVTPVVMGIVYLIAILPTGLLLRISGKELLSLKRDPGVSSYWLDRDPPGPAPESLKDQF